MELPSLLEPATKNTGDTVLVSCGLGATEPLHSDMCKTLRDSHLTVQAFQRYHDDQLLIDPVRIVGEYVSQMKNTVNELLEKGQRVHLFGVSFGGFLALEAVRHIKEIQSLALIAPILYPRDAFSANIPTGITTDMEQDILEALGRWTPPRLSIPTVAIFGANDTTAPLGSWDSLLGSSVFTRELSGITHNCVSKDPRTHDTLRGFYRHHTR